MNKKIQSLSIIISTYNWPSALDLIISRLLMQIKAKSDLYGLNLIEIIIADDGSSIETTNLINKYNKNITKINNVNIIHVWHEDLGFRKAEILNKAIFKSSGDYLLFLDGDCIPFDDYILRHLSLAEESYFVAGNRIMLSSNFSTKILQNPSLINKIINWGFIDYFSAKYIHKHINKIFSFLRLSSNNFFRYLRSKNWRYPKGCNFAAWRNDLLNINGFDQSFVGWGHEDSDLFIRLLHANILIKNGKCAVPVLHLWHKLASRDRQSENYNELMKRLQDTKFIRAIKGINSL